MCDDLIVLSKVSVNNVNTTNCLGRVLEQQQLINDNQWSVNHF